MLCAARPLYPHVQAVSAHGLHQDWARPSHIWRRAHPAQVCTRTGSAGTFDASAKQTGQLGDDELWDEINNGKHY